MTRLAIGKLANGEAVFAQQHEEKRRGRDFRDEMTRLQAVFHAAPQDVFCGDAGDRRRPDRVDRGDLAQIGIDRGLDQMVCARDLADDAGGLRFGHERVKGVFDHHVEQGIAGDAEGAAPDGQQVADEFYAGIRSKIGEKGLDIERGEQACRLQDGGFEGAAMFGADIDGYGLLFGLHRPEHAV